MSSQRVIDRYAQCSGQLVEQRQRSTQTVLLRVKGIGMVLPELSSWKYDLRVPRKMLVRRAARNRLFEFFSSDILCF